LGQSSFALFSHMLYSSQLRAGVKCLPFFGRGETLGRVMMQRLFLLLYSACVQFMWECFDLRISIQVVGFFDKGGRDMEEQACKKSFSCCKTVIGISCRKAACSIISEL
jgi:hypothetical protein